MALKASSNFSRTRQGFWVWTKTLRLNNNSSKANSETWMLKDFNSKPMEDLAVFLIRDKLIKRFKISNKILYSDRSVDLKLNNSNRIHSELWSGKEASKDKSRMFPDNQLVPEVSKTTLRHPANMDKEWTPTKFNSSFKTKRTSYWCKRQLLDNLKPVLGKLEIQFKFRSWDSMETKPNWATLNLPLPTYYLTTQLWLITTKARIRRPSKIFWLLTTNRSQDSMGRIQLVKTLLLSALHLSRRRLDRFQASRTSHSSTNLSKFNQVLLFRIKAPWITTEMLLVWTKQASDSLLLEFNLFSNQELVILTQINWLSNISNQLKRHKRQPKDKFQVNLVPTNKLSEAWKLTLTQTSIRCNSCKN